MRLLFTSDLHGIIPADERFAELLASGSYDAGVLADIDVARRRVRTVE